ISESEPAFQSWLTSSNFTANLPGLVAHYSFDALAGTNQIANELNPAELSAPIHGNTLANGKTGQAMKFTGDDELTLPASSVRLQPWDQYTIVFSLRIPQSLTNGMIFHCTEGTD